MKTISQIALFALLASSGHSAVLFSENFNSYTPSQALPTGGNWTVANNSGGGTDTVITDSGNVFGEGTGNQYLLMNETGGGSSANVVSQTLALPTLGMISFDANIPAAGNTDLFNFRIGSGNSNGNTAFALQFGAGSTQMKVFTTTGSIAQGTQIAVSNFNTPAHITIVYNYSNASASYDAGSLTGTGAGTLNAYSMDIFVNGVLVTAANDVAANSTSISSLSLINIIGTNGTKVGSLWVDNVLVQDFTSAIPEPSSFAFIGGLGTLCFCAIRRRRL